MVAAAVVNATVSESEARFDAKRRRIGTAVAPVVFGVLLLVPMGGLDPRAQSLAAVAAATVVLWVTEAIPLATASVLGPTAAVLLGIADAKTAYAAFSDPLIFLFLGGFLLADGLARQGFDRRAALWLISRKAVAGSPRRALIAIALVAFVFSMWISNTATTAMLIPVALGLADTMRRVLGDEYGGALDRFAGGMCLTLAYASSLGGAATPIGTAPNVIAIGMLGDMAGVDIGFLEWMAMALPASTVGVVVVIWVASRYFEPPVARIDRLTEEVDRQLADLGPMTRGEWRSVGIFGIAIVGWLFPSIVALSLGEEHWLAVWADETLIEGVVAMACASLLFFVPDGRDKPAKILDGAAWLRLDWSTLLLLGGGLSLGRMTFETGLAEAIGRGVLDVAGPLATSTVGLAAAASLLVIFLTEVTSNTATTSMMLPVIIGVAQVTGSDPTIAAVVVTLAASFAFMLPVSTPPNAIAYGTRLIRLDTMMRIGIRLDLLGYVVLMLMGLSVVPLVLG